MATLRNKTTISCNGTLSNAPRGGGLLPSWQVMKSTLWAGGSHLRTMTIISKSTPKLTCQRERLLSPTPSTTNGRNATVTALAAWNSMCQAVWAATNTTAYPRKTRTRWSSTTTIRSTMAMKNIRTASSPMIKMHSIGKTWANKCFPNFIMSRGSASVRLSTQAFIHSSATRASLLKTWSKVILETAGSWLLLQLSPRSRDV